MAKVCHLTLARGTTDVQAVRLRRERFTGYVPAAQQKVDMSTDGHHHHEPLPPPTEADAEGYLADVMSALGDTPETVISLHFLDRGECEVLCVGVPSDMEGIIIQTNGMPEEPSAYGTSAEAIASLIPHLTGWAVLNVPEDLVADLVEPVAMAAGVESVRMLDDIYHVRTEPMEPSLHGEARLLTSLDLPLLAAATDLVGDGFDRLRDVLEWGFVAGVERNGALVSLAHTFAASERHMDIGVATLAEWRGHHFASMVGSVVTQAILDSGRTAVWSTGGINLPSLQVARRLGFTETGRRTYLIPEFEETEDSENAS